MFVDDKGNRNMEELNSEVERVTPEARCKEGQEDD
jgi:hypothetical protein